MYKFHSAFVKMNCFKKYRPSFVPSLIAVEKLMVRNGKGQSSHVLVFCVNFEMSDMISFTLESPSYVYIAVSDLQYICC